MKKYALITGASGGIGAATARRLARAGWNLYLHYNQNEERINDLLTELKSFDIEMIPICADLTTENGVHIVCDSIFNLNAIVYTSGIAPYGLFVDLSEQTIDEMLQIHVKSPLVMVQKLLPQLMKTPESSIVLISSIWGQTGAACEVMYSTVKGAQIAFMKAIGKEIARSGTRVNCVAPGAVKTNMLSGFSQEELDMLESEIPVGRLAEPDEISDVISFLLSKESSYITGQVIGVNGGWYT